MSTRLPGPKFKDVFDRGRSVKGRLLVAWCYPYEGADRKAGVVVSKKTFHDAVDRNRAKRLMREAYRLIVKEDLAPQAVEWIFIARRAIVSAKCGEVKSEMLRIMGAKR